MGNCTQANAFDLAYSTPTTEPSSCKLGEVIRVGEFSEIRSSLDLPIVIKSLKVRPEELPGVRHELKQWRKLQHPNIVQCLKWEESLGTVYITLERCDRFDLRDRIKKQSFDLLVLKALAKDLLTGLVFVHNQKTVHGCIKPTHVLFKGTQALLTDFGVKKPVNSLYYLAPETLGGTTSMKGDVWGLGVTLYYAATGKLPFNGISTEEVLRKIMKEEPEYANVHEEFAGVLRGMLEKSTEKRSTAKQALDLLNSEWIGEHF